MTSKIERNRKARNGNTKGKHPAPSNKKVNSVVNNDIINDTILKIERKEREIVLKIEDEVCEEFKEETKKEPKQAPQLLHWFFTFNNYEKKDIEILETKFQKVCKKYVFQEETGENGTPHLQGSIHLIYAMRPTQLKLSKKIHWEKTNNGEKADEYCEKLDSRTGGIYKWGFPCKLRIFTELRPWQQSILDICEKMPNERDIIWIYDKDGCNGKTQFCKYLSVTIKAIGFSGGESKDIGCCLAGHVKAGRDLNKEPTTMTYNMQRCGKIDYSAIESLKDGYIFSPKFESQQIEFNSPHVIIMSNNVPDTSKLSKDRWKVYNIKDNALMIMDIKDVEDIFYGRNKNDDNDNLFIDEE